MHPQADTLLRLDGLLRELNAPPPAPLYPELTLRGGLLLDPLDLADLAGLIGQEFGIEAPAEEVRSLASVGALCDFIEARTSAVVPREAPE